MYINLLYLPLFNFSYLFFLSFLSLLSSQDICYFYFHCFIPQIASCFSFVFQFVLKLVLFLTGKYNFFISFVHQINLLYFIFVGLFSLCLWVYMYMCIFHYFTYYLPDFVTTICLGFIFGFSFLDICFNLTQCHKKPPVESSFLTRDQVLGLWSGSTDSQTLDYQRTNPREYQTVRTHTKETT